MAQHPKLIVSPHYHIWTDALHARSLAHQARNRWDRGTYVRWCVSTAWTALEIACQDATNDDSIAYSFKKYLDRAVSNGRKPPLEWGAGIWQQVARVQTRRKNNVHRFMTDAEEFPLACVADETILVIRTAIESIYRHMDETVPTWVADDEDRGWDKGGPASSITGVWPGADRGSTSTIRVCYVAHETERESELMPSGSDWNGAVEQLLQTTVIPITKIIVYEGSRVIHSRDVHMRGN